METERMVFTQSMAILEIVILVSLLLQEMGRSARVLA